MDENYIYPNYAIEHGDQKQGLIRISKKDLSIEIFDRDQWRPLTVADTAEIEREVSNLSQDVDDLKKAVGGFEESAEDIIGEKTAE